MSGKHFVSELFKKASKTQKAVFVGGLIFITASLIFATNYNWPISKINKEGLLAMALPQTPEGPFVPIASEIPDPRVSIFSYNGHFYSGHDQHNVTTDDEYITVSTWKPGGLHQYKKVSSVYYQRGDSPMTCRTIKIFFEALIPPAGYSNWDACGSGPNEITPITYPPEMNIRGVKGGITIVIDDYMNNRKVYNEDSSTHLFTDGPRGPKGEVIKQVGHGYDVKLLIGASQLIYDYGSSSFDSIPIECKDIMGTVQGKNISRSDCTVWVKAGQWTHGDVTPSINNGYYTYSVTPLEWKKYNSDPIRSPKDEANY